MAWFIVVVGALLMVKGGALILVPRKLIHSAAKMFSLKQAKRFGWVPIIVGFLLCVSANASYLALPVFLLGLLFIAKGAYILFTPLDKLKKHKLFSLSDGVYRMIGIVVLVVGMVLLYGAM
ncbi:MAG: hypothetical protein Q8N14_03310 [Candidatus Omnitrophota bacterium]|nr:hypothetical protein [Candidatus Omnitrophota bacterium]